MKYYPKLNLNQIQILPFDDHACCAVYMFMLSKTTARQYNHKTNHGIIRLRPGDCAVSARFIGNSLGLSKGIVRRKIRMLEKLGLVIPDGPRNGPRNGPSFSSRSLSVFKMESSILHLEEADESMTERSKERSKKWPENFNSTAEPGCSYADTIEPEQSLDTQDEADYLTPPSPPPQEQNQNDNPAATTLTNSDFGRITDMLMSWKPYAHIFDANIDRVFLQSLLKSTGLSVDALLCLIPQLLSLNPESPRNTLQNWAIKEVEIQARPRKQQQNSKKTLETTGEAYYREHGTYEGCGDEW